MTVKTEKRKKVLNIVRGICVSDGHILMTYNKEKNFFFLPGGKVEFGENIYAALRRELIEESGVESNEQQFICMSDDLWEDNEFRYHEFNYYIRFKMNEGASKSVLSKEDHIDFQWVAIEDISKKNILPHSCIKVLKTLTDNHV